MKWIKVEDKLPEVDKWVLCFLPNIHFHGELILSMKLYFHEWLEKGEIKKMPMFSNIDRSWRLSDVTHWMPLPEVPK